MALKDYHTWIGLRSLDNNRSKSLSKQKLLSTASSTSERAKECRPAQIGHCKRNRLQKLRFLLIWGNGRQTEDAHFGTQKGFLSVWPQRQASLRAVSSITVIAWTLVMSKSMSKLDSSKFRKSECCFLEASLSTKDLNAGNDPIPNPLVYKNLARLVPSYIWEMRMFNTF